MNNREISSNIKRELLGLKWVINTTRQLKPPPPYQPGALFGAVWCPSTNYSLQISIFQIHQIFNFIIFLNLNYHLRKKNLSFPKCPKSPKNLHKTAKQWLMK